jgi:hypothetical protein
VTDLIRIKSFSMEKNISDILQRALPTWAVKEHPTRKGMSAIHPMAIIDVLNEAFGIGAWQFTTEFISCDKETQKTKFGERQIYVSAVKGTLIVPRHHIHIEQFGGSTNDDKGDSLKGGATDALTKCASYLGVGATIYKGQGNIDGFEMSTEDAFTALREASTLDELKSIFMKLPKSLQQDAEIVSLKDELKTKLS